MYTADLIQEITERLSSLYAHITINASSNRTDLNLDSEDFFAKLLNMAYGYKLENANYPSFNTPGYDLIDKSKSLLFQVTSDYTRSKIQHTLDTLPASCAGYQLKFLMLAPKKKRIQNTPFSNPVNVRFAKDTDVLSFADLLKQIRRLSQSEIEKIHNYVLSELRPAVFIEVSDSVLASIVDILVRSKSAVPHPSPIKNQFSIDKKIDKNKLGDYRKAIHIAAEYSGKLMGIYAAYESEGELAEASIQLDCHDVYLQLRNDYSNPIDLYIAIVENRLDFVKQSANCPNVGIDELRGGVRIVVADAFLKCNVFEGPDLTKGDQ